MLCRTGSSPIVRYRVIFPNGVSSMSTSLMLKGGPAEVVGTIVSLGPALQSKFIPGFGLAMEYF